MGKDKFAYKIINIRRLITCLSVGSIHNICATMKVEIFRLSFTFSNQERMELDTF